VSLLHSLLLFQQQGKKASAKGAAAAVVAQNFPTRIPETPESDEKDKTASVLKADGTSSALGALATSAAHGSTVTTPDAAASHPAATVPLDAARNTFTTEPLAEADTEKYIKEDEKESGSKVESDKKAANKAALSKSVLLLSKVARKDTTDASTTAQTKEDGANMKMEEEAAEIFILASHLEKEATLKIEAAKIGEEMETAAKQRRAEEVEAKRQEEEAARKRKELQEMAAKREMDEEEAEAKRREEAAAVKREEDVAAAKKRKEEEIAAKKRKEEEAAAKKVEEKESATKKQEAIASSYVSQDEWDGARGAERDREREREREREMVQGSGKAGGWSASIGKRPDFVQVPGSCDVHDIRVCNDCRLHATHYTHYPNSCDVSENVCGCNLRFDPLRFRC
jgi:hypothetical protein